MDIKLPRLGEGAESGTVVSIFVKAGDQVKEGQTILELENEKAVAPIPASASGRVAKLYVKEGDKITAGQSILALAEDGAGTPAADVPHEGTQPAAATPAVSIAQPRRPSQEIPGAAVLGAPVANGTVAASPTVRKLAQDLGIDLTRVRGSEHGGRIALEDLRAYIQQLQHFAFESGNASATGVAVPKPASERIDFAKWGPYTRQPMSSVRKIIAQRMHESWASVPRVTQFDEADITGLVALRKKYMAKYEKKGGHLTLTPFLIVTAFAALYTRFSGSWELRALFYGVAPVIVALILKASWQLGRKTLKADPLGWALAVAAAVITALLQKELVVLFIGAGLLGSLWWSRGQPPPKPASTSGALLVFGGAGMQAPAAKLFLFFFKTAFLVFGSGLVIAPFLKAYVVDQYHWLDDRQFLDAVAVGMITPGPVVITATFVGFLLDGLAGAGAATAGIFAPSVLLTLIAAPLLKRYRQNPYVQGFVKGVVAAVVGALLGTTLLVARTAIGDVFTAAAALIALTVVLRWNKLPEPLVVLAAAFAGLAAYPLLNPAWM